MGGIVVTRFSDAVSSKSFSSQFSVKAHSLNDKGKELESEN
jgi:hypothetical protein